MKMDFFENKIDSISFLLYKRIVFLSIMKKSFLFFAIAIANTGLFATAHDTCFTPEEFTSHFLGLSAEVDADKAIEDFILDLFKTGCLQPSVLTEYFKAFKELADNEVFANTLAGTSGTNAIEQELSATKLQLCNIEKEGLEDKIPSLEKKQKALEGLNKALQMKVLDLNNNNAILEQQLSDAREATAAKEHKNATQALEIQNLKCEKLALEKEVAALKKQIDQGSKALEEEIKGRNAYIDGLVTGTVNLKSQLKNAKLTEVAALWDIIESQDLEIANLKAKLMQPHVNSQSPIRPLAIAASNPLALWKAHVPSDSQVSTFIAVPVQGFCDSYVPTEHPMPPMRPLAIAASKHVPVLPATQALAYDYATFAQGIADSQAMVTTFSNSLEFENAPAVTTVAPAYELPEGFNPGAIVYTTDAVKVEQKS